MSQLAFGVYVLREVTSSVILDMSVWITFVSQAEETRIGREAEALRSAGIERKQPSLGFDSAVSRRDSSPNLARRAAGGLVSGGTPIISLCLRTDGRARMDLCCEMQITLPSRLSLKCFSKGHSFRFRQSQLPTELGYKHQVRQGDVRQYQQDNACLDPYSRAVGRKQPGRWW